MPLAENRVIGNAGTIPWYLPEDFKWFKRTTMGGILVMGRKTYESIGRPQPGRDNYVLSRSPRAIPGVHSFTSLDLLDQLQTDKTIWIAGGAEVYRQMLPRCGELYLTRAPQAVATPPFPHSKMLCSCGCTGDACRLQHRAGRPAPCQADRDRSI